MLENNKINTGVNIGTNIDAGLRSYMLKVYNYMATGLLITGFAGYLMVATGLVNLLYSQNSQGAMSFNIFGWIVLLAPLVLVFMFNSSIGKLNIRKAQLIFFGFATLLGFSIANILLIYTGASVLKVFLITAGTFGAMSLYGYTTKKDLTGMGTFLMMGLFGLIIASIVNIFLQSSMMDFILSLIGVAIFVGLTAYDTQKIRAMYSSYDSRDVADAKAISGALALYLDFLNMFLYLMRLFGDRR